MLFPTACERGAQPTPEPTSNAATMPIGNDIESAVPMPEPALDREALLRLVAAARSAFAAGLDDGEAQRELAGRQFTFPMRFGCAGPSEGASDAPMRWSYDEREKRLVVSARQDITTETPALQPWLGRDIEAVEGFWVPHPWILTDACPAGGVAGPAESAPSFGIAEFFSPSDSRVGRRAGRPYEAVERIEPADVPTAGGLRLVVSGRLAPLADGRVVHCTAMPAGTRPVCIVSVQVDRVAIETPARGTLLAEWASG